MKQQGHEKGLFDHRPMDHRQRNGGFFHNRGACLGIILGMILLTAVLDPSTARAASRNPFEGIRFFALGNGLTVALAPSEVAANVALTARVYVGKRNEERGNLGIGHLLEHLVFRDSQFDEATTYVQLFSASGGEINARIGRDKTSYQATVPADKGAWAVNVFARMLFAHSSGLAALERAKKSIELEIGEPSWYAAFLGFDPFAPFSRWFATEKGFYESEFGIAWPNYSRNETRLSVRELAYEQVLTHYDQYYRPANTVLFIAGAFLPEEMEQTVRQAFDHLPNRPPKPRMLPPPVPTKRPYLRTDVDPFETPNVWIGTKMGDVSARDRMVLEAYLDYLAERLMRELRNRKGETYTARAYIRDRYGVGFGAVSFETQRSELDKNLKYVQSLLEQEARQGKLSDAEIQEGLRFTREQRYELADVDAETLLRYSEYLHEFKTDYGSEESPYEILTSLEPDEFRQRLGRLFASENAYLYLRTSYAIFKGDGFVLSIGSLLAAIAVFKLLLRRRIDPTNIRWARSISGTPGRFLEAVGILVLAIVVNWIATAHFERMLSSSNAFNTPNLVPQYLYLVVDTFLFVGILVGLLACFPRRLLVEGDSLVIKSMAFYAKRFASSEIESISSVSRWSFILKPWHWLNWGFRWVGFTPFFWRRALLLRIRGGRTYLMELKNADDAASDLKNNLLDSRSGCG